MVTIQNNHFYHEAIYYLQEITEKHINDFRIKKRPFHRVLIFIEVYMFARPKIRPQIKKYDDLINFIFCVLNNDIFIGLLFPL